MPRLGAPFRWEKLGPVFALEGARPDWMRSHAYLPTALVLGDAIRVFMAFRDEHNVGRMGWVDFSADGQFEVLGISERPCLDVGRPGAFDDNGVSPTAVVRDEDGALRCYYAGWQLTPRARYLLFTGAAASTDDGLSFTRLSETPVFERSSDELIVRSGAFVARDRGVWKAWYAAGSDLVQVGGQATPTYDLAYMESADGLLWPPAGQKTLRPKAPDEFGFGRSFVEARDGLYHLWYSLRSRTYGYYIGYGVSADGQSWTRYEADGGLMPSPSGWDSEMVGFPSIVDTPAGRFMFYNGNGYGATGVGVARMEEA
jgi:hypothetical protein